MSNGEKENKEKHISVAVAFKEPDQADYNMKTVEGRSGYITDFLKSKGVDASNSPLLGWKDIIVNTPAGPARLRVE